MMTSISVDECDVHKMIKKYKCTTCNDEVCLCVICFSETHVGHVLGEIEFKLRTLTPGKPQKVKPSGIPRTAKKTLALLAAAAAVRDAPVIQASILSDNSSTRKRKRDVSGKLLVVAGNESLTESVSKRSVKQKTDTPSVVTVAESSNYSSTSSKTDDKPSLTAKDSDEHWKDNFKQLKRFINSHGHSDALVTSDNKTVAALKTWFDAQLIEKEAGTLQTSRQVELQCLVDRGSIKWLCVDGRVSANIGSGHSDNNSMSVSLLTKSDSSRLASGSSRSTHTASTASLFTTESSSLALKCTTFMTVASEEEEEEEADTVPAAAVIPVPVKHKKNPPAKRVPSAAYKKGRDTAVANDDLWWRNFSLLLAYGDGHRSCNVPLDHIAFTEEGEAVQLGRWLDAQHRGLYGMKNHDRYDALNELCLQGKLWVGETLTDDEEGDGATTGEEDMSGHEVTSSAPLRAIDSLIAGTVSEGERGVSCGDVIYEVSSSSSSSSSEQSLDTLLTAAESLLSAKRMGDWSYRVFLSEGGEGGDKDCVSIGKVSLIANTPYYQLSHRMVPETPRDLINSRYSQETTLSADVRVPSHAMLFPNKMVTFKAAPVADGDTCSYFVLNAASMRAVAGIKQVQEMLCVVEE